MIRHVILGLVLFATGCGTYCWQAAHVQEKGCVVVHQIVDCTEMGVISVGPALAALVRSFVTGGQVDWTQVAAIAKSLGFKDGGCFLADLEGDFTQKAALQKANKLPSGHEGVNYSLHATAAQSTLTTWRRENDATDVKFKVRSTSGEVSLR